MKKYYLILCSVFLLSCFYGISHATSEIRSDGSDTVVYDSENNVYLMPDQGRGEQGPSQESVLDQLESRGERLEQALSLRTEVAKAKLMLAAKLACKSGGCRGMGVTRDEITDGIAHYTMTLSVGDGDYDFIAVHRVVKERKPGLAERAESNLFMIHGDLWDFESAFLASTLSDAVPVEQAMPIYLAQNGVDVWGIDLRFHDVPAGLLDYTFMAEQGLDTMISDTQHAINIARIARVLTRQGFDKINVLGWSRGVWLAYALANAEAAKPSWKRHIGGLIPVEAPYKVDPNDAYSVELFCAVASFLADLVENEVYQADNFLLIYIGQLAATAPDEPSPLLPGFTNQQVAIGVGSITFYMLTPWTPTYHLTAGTFDEFGMPVGLLYTDPALWIDVLQLSAPIESNPYMADTTAIACGATDVPYDDHLAEIDIPVLYVGTAGGFGDVGLYTTTLLQGADVSVHMVQLEPPALAWIDFGHSDLFLAAEAEDLMWEPVRAWLAAH